MMVCSEVMQISLASVRPVCHILKAARDYAQACVAGAGRECGGEGGSLCCPRAAPAVQPACWPQPFAAGALEAGGQAARARAAARCGAQSRAPPFAAGALEAGGQAARARAAARCGAQSRAPPFAAGALEAGGQAARARAAARCGAQSHRVTFLQQPCGGWRCGRRSRSWLVARNGLRLLRGYLGVF
jgi:hypothetical protein